MFISDESWRFGRDQNILTGLFISFFGINMQMTSLDIVCTHADESLDNVTKCKCQPHNLTFLCRKMLVLSYMYLLTLFQSFYYFFSLLSLLFHVQLKAAIARRFILASFSPSCSCLNNCSCMNLIYFLILQVMFCICFLSQNLFVASFYLWLQNI